MKLVSVIIPLHNAIRFIEACLLSVIHQTYQNIEIIIVNDRTNDGSIEIVKRYLNDRIKLVNSNRPGASAARNHGLEIAIGDYIQFLDADDLLDKNKISVQLQALNSSTTNIAVCGTLHFFSEEELNKINPNDIEKRHLDQCYKPIELLKHLYGIVDDIGGMIQTNAWLVPKNIVEKAGPWNEELTVDDDGEYFCRIILNSTDVVYVDHVLNFYRKHQDGSNLSDQKLYNAKKSSFDALCLKQQHLASYYKRGTNTPNLALSFYKLATECYPMFKSLSKQCINMAFKLDKKYAKKKIFIGGSLTNFIANHISWRLSRMVQHYKEIVKNYLK
ncbi:glycosyltransferase family 2 protein [Pedobacter agri]|uniref:glycosyltransferase family 2 protein n=1 Tax=Pedobacter agri TaxID=454586 RepID=UPI00277DE98F|nr:glycosyltransferase [Pedobacter agri]MDQ1141884.1 glycosyltransferase involved in cell wall biosynthesis [Pedobacter agri]